MKRIFFTTLFFSIFLITAQDNDRVITTAVPFLSIAGDARAAGLGDMGVATPVDLYAQQWNPAKYAFAEYKMGAGLSYTPFLQSIAQGISLLEGALYNKVSDRSAFAFSIRYFGLGEIELRQTFEQTATIVKPNEFAIDGSYSLQLSETFAMAVGGRFISSNLRFQDSNQDSQAANSFAVDVAGFYQSREIVYNNFNGRWRAGFNLSNLGPKIQYDENGQENFLPTNLKFGAGFDFIFDADNTLGIYSEFNKLLVPTPRDFDGDGDIDSEDNNTYSDITFLDGVFESFGDAPNGFSEELEETTWALGAEYRYQEALMLRMGYFNESLNKGARRFFSLGGGFKFQATQIDLSYLFSTAQVRSPLEGSLRVSLTFNIGEQLYPTR